MMDKLKEALSNGDCNLAILHEGHINTFKGRGVRVLYHILDDAPELLLGSKLADKAVGRTAAKAMIDGGVAEIWAEIISQEACEMLRSSGIKVSYQSKVDHATFLKLWERMGETME